MNGTPWTEAELATLRQLFPEYSADIVARVIGRNVGSVYRKAAALQIAKSQAFKDAERARIRHQALNNPKLIANRWGKSDPWNKGKHWVAGGRSAETRFQPGQVNHNTLPLGSYRIAANAVRGWSQLERKTSEAKGGNNKRWTPVSRLVWEEHHGPVPAGHIVVFKPGMKTIVLELITIDRLECITRTEHARRNSHHTRYPELVSLIAIKAHITREANRINREAQENRP